MPAAPARLPSHPASPRRSPNLLRPWVLQGRGRRRLGYRLASGLTPAQAARAEGLPEAEVEGLLAEPGFAALVEAYRELEARPAEEARRRLVSLARFLLDEALLEGDVRAALFVLRQDERSRDPAEVLADGVLAAHRRAATPPRPTAPAVSPDPRPAAAPSRASRDPLDRSLERVAACLRDRLADERLAVHLATAADPAVPAPADPAPTTPAVPSCAQVNRRERRRRAAVARRTPVVRVPDPRAASP